MDNPMHYSEDTTMRQDDRVTTVTFTLPAGHKWTSVEEALKSAHDQEYELRMAFFWECQRLKTENERLRKAGDAICAAYELGDDFLSPIQAWNAAKEGKPSV